MEDRRGPGWLAVFLISIVVSSAAIAAFQWAAINGHLPPLLTVSATVGQTAAPHREPSAESVKVPQLTGLPVAVAGELLSARGLRIVVRERRAHDTSPADTIIDQEPLSDSVMAEHSPVIVTVSTGPAPSLPVPDVAGQTLAEATKAIEAAGLAVAPRAETDAKDGMVESTVPAAGQPAARGTAIELVLKAPLIAVPKVVGLPLARAKKLLEDTGFVMGKVREGDDDSWDPGVVLKQIPEAGAKVAKGSSVELVRNYF